jgi:formylglycine-generating enzyme
MAVKEHGITFRYIPAGTFLMGSDTGEPDESPVHSVRLDDYWLAEVPMSWAAYCDLMGWKHPPAGRPGRMPREGPGRVPPGFMLNEANKIRLQYCEDETVRATDWHTHTLPHDWTRDDGQKVDSRTLFGGPEREDPLRPWRYDRKPMVSVAWQEAEELCTRLSTPDIRYSLPTEAEWERATRGGLAGCRYPSGNEPPNSELCDFDRFNDFSILPTHRLPPNGYGLYAMTGSVWEWTADWYDAEYYPLRSDALRGHHDQHRRDHQLALDRWRLRFPERHPMFFGLARAQTASSQTRTGLIIGTVAHVAPEQV